MHDYNKLLMQLNPIKSSDDAIGFFSGSTFTTLFIMAMDWHILVVFFGRVIGALIIGVVGGWAGLMGKDLYKYMSCKDIYKFIHKRKYKNKDK